MNNNNDEDVRVYRLLNKEEVSKNVKSQMRSGKHHCVIGEVSNVSSCVIQLNQRNPEECI